MRQKAINLWAIAILAIGARAFGVFYLPFEQDEMYTVHEATDLFQTGIKPGIQARPVFFLLEHPLMVSLPHTQLVLRGLPFLFGILGLWATWRLARRVIGEHGAIVAMVLVAVSPWHMYASTFGRYYSLIYLLAALAYWRLSIAYETNRASDYAWALLPLLVGTWTHPSFVFPVCGAVVALSLVDGSGALRWRWPSRQAWMYLWIPLIGSSVMIWVAIRGLGNYSSVDNGGDRGLLATLRLVPAMVDWMTPTVFVAALIGAVVLAGATVQLRRQFGLMVLAGGAAMLVALFLLSFKTAIYADYGIAALPLATVAAAGAAAWIGELAGVRRKAAMATVALLMVVGMLPSFASHLSDGTRFDYRDAYARIGRDGAEDAVLTWPLILQKAYAPELRAYELPRSRPELESVLAKEGVLWAVVSVKRYGIVGDDRGDLKLWLAEHCRLVDSHQRPRLDYRLHRVDLWRCHANS